MSSRTTLRPCYDLANGVYAHDENDIDVRVCHETGGCRDGGPQAAGHATRSQSYDCGLSGKKLHWTMQSDSGKVGDGGGLISFLIRHEK